jgi:hypothetical protein
VRNDLPHNMQTLLQKRLDALSPEALLIFQACAVLGENATVDRIGRVVGLQLTALAAPLQELELAGLIVGTRSSLFCRHQLLVREALRRLPVTVAGALHTNAANTLKFELDAQLNLAIAHACLLHFAAADQPSVGVRVAISLARRFMDVGMPNDARAIADAANALGPVGRDRAEVLSLRLFASRASGAWNEVTLALAEIDSLRLEVDEWDDGELRRIAFDARKYSGDSVGVESQLAILQRGDLSPGAKKRVAINALIACSDDFEQAAADHVFSEYFRPYVSRLATFEDLVGNLLYHCSFGSLDRATETALAIVAGCRQKHLRGYRQTQLIRWCARPFHLSNNEDQAQELLSEACSVATTSGQLGEAHECRVQNVMYALDLEDWIGAAQRLGKLVGLASASRAAYVDATLHLLKLREAVARNDTQTARACMINLDACRLPECRRVSLTLSACRIHVAALMAEAPNESDVENILGASASALSSMDMDWTVSALCRAELAPARQSAARNVVSNYLKFRRPRYPIPSLMTAFLRRFEQVAT